MTVREQMMTSGRWAKDGWRWLRPPTPHLTSPLKGGRDELGKGCAGAWGWVRGFLPAQE